MTQQIFSTHGLGAFLYPTSINFNSNDQNQKLQIVFRGNILNENLVITNYGFIGIIIKKANDDNYSIEKDNSIRNKLNILFFVLERILRIRIEMLKLGDLCNFAIHNNEIKICTYVYSLRNILSIKDNNITNSKHFKVTKQFCPKNLIVRAVNLTNDILKHEDVSKQILLLYQGYSLDFNQEYTSAFLYGWMLIENFIGESWEIYVNQLQRNSNEKEQLKQDHRLFTSFHYVEILEMVKIINDEQRKHFHSLRKKRNDIVHNFKDVNQSDSNLCLKTAESILFYILNNKGLKFYNQ